MRSLGRWGLIAGAALLMAARLYSLALTPPLLWLQAGAVLAGAVLALTDLRASILVVTFVAPLMPIVVRNLGVPDLSPAESFLLPVLLVGAVRAARAAEGPRRGSTGPLLAAFLTLVSFSAGWGLWEYQRAGVAPWPLLGRPVTRHFSFDIFDEANGIFGLVHGAIVLLEGGLWFALLTSGATNLRARDLRRALMLAALVVGVTGVAQSVWSFGLADYFRRAQPYLLRINSTLSDPNTLGSYLVLVFPLGIAAAFERAEGTRRAIAWTALLGYCLAASVSRTAWVGFVASAFLAAVLLVRSARAYGLPLSPRALRRIEIATLALAGATAALIAIASIADLGSGITYRGARSPWEMLVFSLNLRRPIGEILPSRPLHWQAAVEIWKDSPVFGAGVGKYVALKNRYLPDARLQWIFFTDTHNYFLKVLAEMGVVGLIAFSALIGSLFVQARRICAGASVLARRRVTAAALGVAGLLVCSLGQDPLALRDVQYVFWAVAALIFLERGGEFAAEG